MYTRNKGFTLIEMMIVISIIGLLLSIVIPDLIKSRDKAKVQTCRASLKGLQDALELFRLDNKGYPKNLNILTSKEYLAEKIIQDPWLNDFYYVPIVQKVKKKTYNVNYVLLSKGPDGLAGTTDDISAPVDSNRHNFDLIKAQKQLQQPVLQVTPEVKVPVVTPKTVIQDKKIKK